MSAFAGLLRTPDRAVRRGDLERLSRSLPRFDEAPGRIWMDGPAGLVHRLYRITPEDRFEQQPLGDGRHWLVFAGWLSDRDALAAQLGLWPSQIREMPDSALCLKAIARWGDDAPSYLYGAFALACWNTQAKTLLLARGRTGGRSLFLHRGNRFVAFATSPTALHALPDVPRALDKAVVGDFLANNVFETTRTFYSGIERLPAGHLAYGSAAGVAVRRYWAPARRDLGITHHADAVEAAREHLDRAVASHLRSAAPVAATATGGLDSSGVAATAARALAPEQLTTYTRTPSPGADRSETASTYIDEEPPVRALARLHPNITATFIDDGPSHAFDGQPAQLFLDFGGPVPGAQNLTWFAPLFDRIARAGHRVVLTGDGGNFSMGWRGRHRLREMMRAGQWLGARRELLALHRVQQRPLRPLLYDHLFGWMEPGALRGMRRRLQGLGAGLEHNTFVAPGFAREHRLIERIEALGGWSDTVRRGDTFAFRAHWLINAAEAVGDVQSAVTGCWGFEMRSPLTDPRLVEFCLNLPETHYLRDGRERALQRDTIADRVPPEIADNYKVGQQSTDWFERLCARRDAIAADIDQIAASPLASHAIDLEALRSVVARWPRDAREARQAPPRFRHGLSRALHFGAFIRWFEGGNG